MQHRYIEKETDHPVFLLLHGTGGSENDLIPVAEMIDPDASILTVRGNVTENGMARFFKRLEEGVFDEEDLIKQTTHLHEFLDEASTQYGFKRDEVIALGYSNGANIAGSLLMHFKHSVRAAILYHPMVPIRDITYPDQTGMHVFIGAGEKDPLVDVAETNELIERFKSQGIEVEALITAGGHQLTHDEIAKSKQWYESMIRKK